MDLGATQPWNLGVTKRLITRLQVQLKNKDNEVVNIKLAKMSPQ